MLLSQFCYGILFNEEDILFPEKDDDVSNVEDATGHDEEWWWMNGNPNPLHRGVMPLVGRNFTPFVYYGAMKAIREDKGRQYVRTIELLSTTPHFALQYDEIDEQIYGPEKGVHSRYVWETDERGWAPEYFNAGFDWFSYTKITSTYNKDAQRMVISHMKRKELVA